MRGRPLVLVLLLLSGCMGFFSDGQVDVDGDGFTPEAGDCDDRDAAVAPTAAEVCDGVDNDCDGAVDGEDPELADGDGDGFDACADCDDSDPGVAPGGDEVCDGVDTDCDGVIPEEEADADKDGDRVCAGDCDDADADRGPSAAEVCDGADTDCDGDLPADDSDIPDGDMDGVRECDDCDDADPMRTPGAVELCDGVDNDCFMGVPTAELDGDNDTWAPCAGDCDDSDPLRHPGREEECNGIDDSCAGGVPLDEQDPDNDQWAACEGDCRPLNSLVSPGTVEVCNNNDDDDCDGLIDEPDPAGAQAHLATARTDGALDLRAAAPGALGSPFAAGGAMAFGLPVAAGDLNGDGVTDFLREQIDPVDSTVDAVDRVSLQCTGGWAALPVPSVVLGDDRRVAGLGDLDGDGALDLVTVRFDSGGAGEVESLINDGFGVFGAPQPAAQLVSAGIGAGSWLLPATLHDVTGDALVDLLECGGADHTLCRVHPGVGDGTFAAPSPAFTLGSGTSTISLGDVDGDSLVDLVFGLSDQYDPGALFLSPGDGLGGFGAAVEIADVEPGAESGQGPSAGRGWVRLADLDGDLDLDAAILWDTGVSTDGRAAAVAEGDGAGGMTLGPATALLSVVEDPSGPDFLAAGGL